MIAFILVTTFVSSIFSRQFIDLKYNELENEAAIVKYSVTSKIVNDTDEVPKEIIAAAVKFNVSIWVVDKNMNIKMIFDDGTVQKNIGTLDEETQQYFNDVMSGQDLKRIGNFGKRIDNLVMTYGTKLVQDGQVTGAIFVHANLDELQTYLNSITRQVIISAVASFAVAIILIYSMAQYFTKPLIMMNNYAKKLAKGDFDVRININQKDEVGQLAESFNLMALELKSLDDKRKRFIGDVSHELRAPLSAIQGYVQGITDGTIDHADYLKYLDIVLSETHRLSTLINDLLDLSQVDSGVYPLHKTKFDIVELVDKILKIYEGEFQKKSISVVKVIAENKLTVFADVDRITQVVSNIIDNAIKFSPAYSKIYINLYKKEELVYVEIKDSGPGLSEDDINNIWQPFYQVDTARTPGIRRGSGLGLFIAKSILEQHGSQIGAVSALGAGATFYFYLPDDEYPENS